MCARWVCQLQVPCVATDVAFPPLVHQLRSPRQFQFPNTTTKNTVANKDLLKVCHICTRPTGMQPTDFCTVNNLDRAAGTPVAVISLKVIFLLCQRALASAFY